MILPISDLFFHDNNFSSMTFFCATLILRVICRRRYDIQPIFLLIFDKKNKKN